MAAVRWSKKITPEEYVKDAQNPNGWLFKRSTYIETRDGIFHLVDDVVAHESGQNMEALGYFCGWSHSRITVPALPSGSQA